MKGTIALFFLVAMGVIVVVFNMEEVHILKSGACGAIKSSSAGGSISISRRRSSNNSNDNDVSISIIVVASGQRSSSTHLSQTILTGIPCHLSLNEVTNPPHPQSGDAWKKEGVAMAMNPKWAQNSPSKLADFINQVGKRRCREFLQEGGDMAPGCHNHCWVNYKHFDIHVADWQHAIVWNTLMGHARSFAMTILERSVQERWRSTWIAQNTGDWEAYGTADHIAKVANAQVPPISSDFLQRHRQWFQLIREYAKSQNEILERSGQPTFPVLDFSFSDVTTRPVNITQDVVRRDIMFQ